MQEASRTKLKYNINAAATGRSFVACHLRECCLFFFVEFLLFPLLCSIFVCVSVSCKSHLLPERFSPRPVCVLKMIGRSVYAFGRGGSIRTASAKPPGRKMHFTGVCIHLSSCVDLSPGCRGGTDGQAFDDKRTNGRQDISEGPKDAVRVSVWAASFRKLEQPADSKVHK